MARADHVDRPVQLHQFLDLRVHRLAPRRDDIRVILHRLFPQNAWTSIDAPLSWGIYRNIPFAIMGILIIVLFFNSARERKDGAFKFMWLTIVLSFAFYIPVVLWADAIPLIGMLMIPKTCAYVWTVWIGYSDMKKNRREVV